MSAGDQTDVASRAYVYADGQDHRDYADVRARVVAGWIAGYRAAELDAAVSVGLGDVPPYTRGWRIGDRVRVRATGERGMIDAALGYGANVWFTGGRVDHFLATDLEYDRAAHDRCDREFCGHDRWLHSERSKRCTAGAQRNTSAWRCECAGFVEAAESTS